VLAELSTEGGTRASQLGNPFILSHEFALLTSQEVSARFGPAFADRLFELAPGEWRGPLRSAFGLHLVEVTTAAAEYAPTFEDLAARGIEALSQQELTDLVVGNTLRVVNTVTSEEGLVGFLEDGVQTITLPPHRVIRQDYDIGTDGRLNQRSIRGLPVSFQLFEVDGRYLAARDDETGYCNYEISVVGG
jgi:hypothetical protein